MHKAPSEGTISDKSSEARLWSQTHLFVPGLEPYSLSNLGYAMYPLNSRPSSVKYE